jgi:hypothetical protein
MANDKSKPKAFIVCIRLKDADNIGKYYDDAYVALKQNAGSFDLMISKTVQGGSPLPLGIFKAAGTGSIDNLNAVANSAARSGRPDYVAVFEITDSPESIRLTYHNRETAAKTKPPRSSP